MENSYQLSRIQNYISGLMSKEEMFQLEKEALADPFLQDAIDGYRLQKGVDVKHLSLLQQRLHRRIEDTKATRHTQFYTWQRLAIGSAAGVIFVVLIAFIYFRNFSHSANHATEVELRSPENTLFIEPILAGGDASPIAGWTSFEQYLQRNNTLNNIGGTVHIRFEISKDGKVIDLNFEGVQQEKLVEETKRLMLNGPKWQGAKGQLKIVFPIKDRQDNTF